MSSGIPFFVYRSGSSRKLSANPLKYIHFLIFLIIILSGSLLASPLYKDIEIINSDDNGIAFRLNIVNPDKYISLAAEAKGDIFSIPVLIALPPGTVPFVTNATASKAITPGSNISSYSGSTILAHISGTTEIRGRSIATIEIFPFYQGAFYGRVDVEVEFRRQAAAVPANDVYAAIEGKVFNRIFDYTILNFEQAGSWPVYKSRPAAKMSQDVFVLADEWYKISTSGGHIVKITGTQLRTAGLTLNSIRSDSLHLFYGQGKPLPIRNIDPRPQLEEVAIKIYDGGDNIFDANDYFIFFAEAADRWDYRTGGTPEYIQNPYTDINCYWLGISGGFGTAGLRIVDRDGSPTDSPDTVVQSTIFYSRSEKNKMLFTENDGQVTDYYEWYWSDQNKDSFYVSLPNATPLEPASVKLRAIALDTYGAVTLTVNGIAASKISSQSPVFTFETNRLAAGVLNKFVYTVGDNYQAPPYFDYCEVACAGSLKPSGDILDAAVSGLSGLGEFIITDGFSGAPMIFDISEMSSPVNIINYNENSGEIVFQSPAGGIDPARFYLCPPSKFYTGAVIEKVTAPLLTENLVQTDMIIIAPRQFVPMLDDYKQYRENRSDIRVSIVALENIINQFSYGLYDPTAIRDFLRFAYLNFPEPAPSAVLLVGDASYDFEDNLLTGTSNYIPPFIHELDHTASDDNYVYFGEFGFLDGDSTYLDGNDDRGYDMMVARWPVRNSADLNTIYDKVRSYESSTNYDTWRTTITLVADDEYGSGGHYEGLTHTRQTETLENGHLPAAFRRNKIYSWEYPFNSERAKPDINEAIVKSVNQGTLLINYVGHGNPDTWAHERIFLKGTDLPRLSNNGRLSLFYAASCSIGLFDDPRREGMAEELLRMPGGGAIGVMAATRLVYSGDNGALNRQVFDILFYVDDLSICQALYAAKTYRQYSSGFLQQRLNDRKFAYLGDPMLYLGTPRYKLSFREYPEMLRALDTPYVAGEIIEAASGNHVNMNGRAEIFIHDSELKKTHLGVNDNGDVVDSLTYAKSGPLVYKGSVEIVDGYFDFSFIVPLDIGYGGAGAAIFAYAVSDLFDGFGLVDSIPVSSEVVVPQDSLGPVISYSFGNRENFISGDNISADEPLVLRLADSIGINLTGGAGHGITLCIDNAVENIINLTDLFQYDAGSYISGEIRYEITGLNPGRHLFKVKAWDNANNSATAEFEAAVAEPGDFALMDVLNYPNPMEERTTFSFSLSFPARRVSLEVFTLSGRKIMNYEENMVSADYHEFYTWNGHDADGDRVATGVYIYKVTAFSMNTDDVIESFGKVVVVN